MCKCGKNGYKYFVRRNHNYVISMHGVFIRKFSTFQMTILFKDIVIRIQGFLSTSYIYYCCLSHRDDGVRNIYILEGDKIHSFSMKKNSIILVFISLGFYKCMMPIKEYFNRDNYLCLWFLHSGGIFSCSECFLLHLLQCLQ